MNILKEFLKKNTNLNNLQMIDNMDLDRTNKKSLLVPNCPINCELVDLEMILRVPSGKCIDDELKKVLDYLHNETTFLMYNERKFKMVFLWNKQILFNSFDDKKNELYGIPYKIKITEETNGN